MDRFLLHCLLLAWASLAAAWRMTPGRADRFLATTLLAWANVVVTALVLGTLHRLNEPRGFFLVSALLAALTCLLASRRRESPAAAEGDDSPDRWLQLACILTLAPLAAASVMADYHYGPGNPESVTVHLPRALFYLGQGHLGHFDSGDPRQVLLPFNYNLLQVFGLIYSPPAQCLNFFNLLAWLAAGAAVYRLCRLAGANANASLITSWLLLAATPVLAQAASTTPELAAGAALVGAVVFMLRWRQSHDQGDALLAGLALGLAAGSTLDVLWFSLGAGMILLIWNARSGALPRLADLRPWLIPALVAAALALPFFLINLAYGHLQAGSAWHFLPGFQPFLSAWTPPADLNEDQAGFGIVGFVFLLGACYAAFRPARAAGVSGRSARLGLAWIAAECLLKVNTPLRARDLVPAVLLLGPGLAGVIHSGVASRRKLTSLLLLAATLATGRFAVRYLLDHTQRPVRPLLSPSALPPAAAPELPIPLRRNLSAASWINVDSDAREEALFPFMALKPGQRFTARYKPEAGAFNLLSRSALSLHAGLESLERMPVYAVIAFPGKPTAGVEYLATLGRGPAARNYFGLIPQAAQTASEAINQFLLVTLATDPMHPDWSQVQFRLAGLHLADHVRVTVYEQIGNDRLHALASFTEDGVAPVAISRNAACLLIKLTMAGSGAELTAAGIPLAARPDGNLTEPPAPAPDPKVLFTTELVGAADPTVAVSEGLQSSEGPYPQWDLPPVRWAKKSSFRLTVPATPGLDHLQLFFSVRPQVRESAGLEVRFNGTVVAQYHLGSASAWLDQLLDFTVQPGTNVIEFRDIPPDSPPDWMDYLQRNPDVMNYVTTHHIPLEQGAREHYESSGRREGRILRLRAEPGPGTANYFLFRHIRLAGIKSS